MLQKTDFFKIFLRRMNRREPIAGAKEAGGAG